MGIEGGEGGGDDGFELALDGGVDFGGFGWVDVGHVFGCTFFVAHGEEYGNCERSRLASGLMRGC